MSDYLIIGGGVNGLMTARELLLAGASVTLVEAGQTGREASWAGGGILSPLYPWQQANAVTALFLASRALYPELISTLHADTGIDPEWHRSGLWIADTSDLSRAETWCRQHGLDCDSRPNTQGIPPGLRQQPHHLWLPDIYQLRNPRLLQALRADILKRGARLLENQAVRSWECRNHRISAVITDRQTLSADAVILTLGAWSGQFLSGLLSAPPQIDPVKGQMILFKATPGLLDRMILHHGHYLIPRQDGRILAGSTVELCGFDKTPTDRARTELSQFAYTLLPALRHYPIETQWAGLRPRSPQGIPYIGPHPTLQNLSLNCGHFRNGFVMAPASAQLLVDLLLKRPAVIPAEPYSYCAERDPSLDTASAL